MQVPGILADYVTLDQGSGIVHTAPGHGAEDFLVGQEYGLETYAPLEIYVTVALTYWALNASCAAGGDRLVSSESRIADHSDVGDGPDTIYEWSCHGRRAVAVKATMTVDPQGYIAENWKEMRSTFRGALRGATHWPRMTA